MSESVKILIEADDQASKKIATAAQNVENSIKNIKATGDQAKKSTEFFGAIANALGGSELASYAGQLAGLTDKVSQFAEVQKMGGVGALAFKAGLVAAVGAIAFGMGNALGNVIFQTEKWTRKLAEANAEATKLASKAAKMRATQFSDNKQDVELIADPEQKKAAYQSLLKDLNNNLMGVEADVKRGRKEVEGWNAAWMKFGNRAAFADQAKAKLEEDKARLEVMQDQRNEIEKMLSNRAIDNALIAKSVPLLEGLRNELSSISAAQADISAKSLFAGKTAALDALKEELSLLEKRKSTAEIEEKTGQARLGRFHDETVALEVQVAIAKKKADIAKEETAMQQKSLSYIESLSQELGQIEAARADASGGKKTFTGPNAAVDSLREEIRLLEQKKNLAAIGEIAGKNTFGDKDKIEAEGLLLKIQLSTKQGELQKAEEESAKRIAELKASELQKLEEQNILLTKGAKAAYAYNLEKQGLSKQDAEAIAKQQPVKTEKTVNQAFQSRLLTRGPQDNTAKAVAANTASAVAELKTLNARLEKERQERYTLKVVKS